MGDWKWIRIIAILKEWIVMLLTKQIRQIQIVSLITIIAIHQVLLWIIIVDNPQ